MGKSPLLEAPSCCDTPRSQAEDETREPQIRGHQDGLTLREIPLVEPWGVWEVGWGNLCSLAELPLGEISEKMFSKTRREGTLRVKGETLAWGLLQLGVHSPQALL